MRQLCIDLLMELELFERQLMMTNLRMSKLEIDIQFSPCQQIRIYLILNLD